MENNNRTLEATTSAAAEAEEAYRALDPETVHIMELIGKTTENLQTSISRATWFAREAAHYTMKMVEYVMMLVLRCPD